MKRRRRRFLSIEHDSESSARRVSEVCEEQERRAGDSRWGDWCEQPVPGDRPTMPDPGAPPLPASKTASWKEE